MSFDVAGVDHEPLKIRLVDQLFQEFFPSPLVAPATEAPMGVFPIAIVRRQVAPGCPGAQDPEDSVEKSAIVSGDTAPLPRLPGKMGGEQFPSMIAQIVTVICGWSDTHDFSFAQYSIS